MSSVSQPLGSTWNDQFGWGKVPGAGRLLGSLLEGELVGPRHGTPA